jgi:putative transposase
MILAWRISNTMDTYFAWSVCKMLDYFGEPEYFNSDQDVQFTSSKYLKLFDGLATKNSMDGKERCGWTTDHGMILVVIEI